MLEQVAGSRLVRRVLIVGTLATALVAGVCGTTVLAHATPLEQTNPTAASSGPSHAQRYGELISGLAAMPTTRTASTCDELVASRVIPVPSGWDVRCLDALPNQTGDVQGVTYPGSRRIAILRGSTPDATAYVAGHEAGHAWAAVILDDTAKTLISAQPGVGAYNGGDYAARGDEAFANSFSRCLIGTGGNPQYSYLACDVLTEALHGSADRNN